MMVVGHSSVSVSNRRAGAIAAMKRVTHGRTSSGAKQAWATAGRRLAASRPAAVVVLSTTRGAS